MGIHGQKLARARTWPADASLDVTAIKLNFHDARVVLNGQVLFKSNAMVMKLYEFYPGSGLCLSISEENFSCLAILVRCLTENKCSS